MTIPLFLFRQYLEDSLFYITREKLNFNLEYKKFKNRRIGAVVTFEGRIRNHNNGKDVTSINYEVYEELAKKEGTEIVQQALNRYEILDAICFHRVGRIDVSQTAIWIFVSSTHRKDAFKACEFIIDTIKAKVPIWKNEHYKENHV